MPRPTILIVCEGEKTEPTYFRLLSDELRKLAKIEVDIEADQSSEGTSPEHVVGGAILRRKQRDKLAKKSNAHLPYKDVWAVFDTESHGHPFFQKTPAALSLAKKHGIAVAVSRPCFEVWFVLHFKNNPPAADCYADTEKAINEILETGKCEFKYKKKGKDGDEALRRLFNLLKERLSIAIDNAHKLEESVFSADLYSMPNGQGTRVHVLIQSIMPQTQASRAEREYASQADVVS